MHFAFAATAAVLVALAPDSAPAPGPSDAAKERPGAGPGAGAGLGNAAPPGLTTPETNHDLAYRIGKDIRCPVCQGMSIAESPSTMAQDMMGRVRVMLKEGKSGEDIRAYFVQRYGVWVLLDPPKEGFVLFVWLVPPVVLLGAGLLALRHMRRLKRTREGGSPGVAQSTGAAVASAGAGVSGTGAGGVGDAAPASADAYLKAIREEVQR